MLRHLCTLGVVSGLLVGTFAAAPSTSRAAVDHEAAVAIGEALTVSGGPGVGTNANYFTDFTCSSDPHTTCETVLIKLSNPYEEENAKKGRERGSLLLDLTPTTYPAEVDLALFESDADGTQGSQIGQSGTFAVVDCPSGCESIRAVISTTEEETEVWVLAHVVYFAAAGEYDLDVSFTQ